jgi:rod shape-determining protein MreD
VRVLEIAVAILVAFLLQTIGGRYFWPLQSYLDLFLIASVGFGLTRGRMAGLVTGTASGLVQDSFSGAILGLNGLSKTTVGYLCGVIGHWLIIRGWATRFLVFFLASVADLLILSVLGQAVERPVALGEGLTPLLLCIGNGVVGTFALGFGDRMKKKI